MPYGHNNRLLRPVLVYISFAPLHVCTILLASISARFDVFVVAGFAFVIQLTFVIFSAELFIELRERLYRVAHWTTFAIHFSPPLTPTPPPPVGARLLP